MPPEPSPLPTPTPQTSSPKPNNQPSPGSLGNTPGLITPKPDPNGAIENGQPTALTDPSTDPETPKETSFWGKISGGVHTGLDVLGFIPGLGAIPDLANAGIYALEGDMVSAGISAVAAVPGVGDAAKAGTMVAKGAKAVAKKATKEIAEEGVEKVTKEAAEEGLEKATKEGAEHATKKPGKASGKGKKKTGGYKKGKGKLKCGKTGSFGDLNKSTGDNMFDRDHVPSKAALKKRAEKFLSDDLTEAQIKKINSAIEKEAAAIAIPKEDHAAGGTYTKKNTPEQILEDSNDLQGAAKKDTDAIQKNTKKMDPKCRRKYKRWAAELVKKTNAEYDDWLNTVIDKALK